MYIFWRWGLLCSVTNHQTYYSLTGGGVCVCVCGGGGGEGGVGGGWVAGSGVYRLDSSIKLLFSIIPYRQY